MFGEGMIFDDYDIDHEKIECPNCGKEIDEELDEEWEVGQCREPQGFEFTCPFCGCEMNAKVEFIINFNILKTSDGEKDDSN